MFCVALICLKQKQKDRTNILKEDALIDEEVGECSSVRTLSITSRPSTSGDMGWTVSHRPQRIRPRTAAVRVERPPESPAPREFLPGPPIVTVHSDDLNDDELKTIDESIENVIPCETPRLTVEEGADRPATAISMVERPPEIPQLREFLAADDSDGTSVSTGIAPATDEATAASDSPTLIMVQEAEHPEPYDETDYENTSGESGRPSTSETQEPYDSPPPDTTHRVGRSTKVTPLGEASPKERPPGRLSRRPRGARPKENTNNNANNEATKAEEGERKMHLSVVYALYSHSSGLVNTS